MLLPITLYGATDCDDTERTRSRLRDLGIPFREVDIDHDAEAERFVIFVNRGYRSTPTLVLGEGKRKIILTEPTSAELDEALAHNLYSPTPNPLNEGDTCNDCNHYPRLHLRHGDSQIAVLRRKLREPEEGRPLRSRR